jgi:hypothetical protein
MHLVPVNPLHSVHEFAPQVSVVGVAVMQQTGPPPWKAVQSIASLHSQSMDPVGQAVPPATQVDGGPEAAADSQQCWPAAQLMSLPPSTPLKGQ